MTSTSTTKNRPAPPSPNTVAPALDQAPATLSDEDLFRLRIDDGLSLTDIAILSGRSPNAVGRALRRVEAELFATSFSPLFVRAKQILDLRQVGRALMREVDRHIEAEPGSVPAAEFNKLIHALVELSRREAQIVGSDAAGPWSVGARVEDLDDPDEVDEAGKKVDSEMQFALEIEDLIELTDRLVVAGVAGISDEERDRRKAATREAMGMEAVGADGEAPAPHPRTDPGNRPSAASRPDVGSLP